MTHARGASIRQLYLPVEPDAAFGLFHPAQTDERRSAVLLCPPFGWAEACSYRARLEWAHHLAARGHPTLRIDLPGTGDSAGELSPGDRLPAWIAAVQEGAAWLRAEEPAAGVTVIGIELGALVALLAVAAGARVDELVLWGAHARGAAWVRELRAMGRLERAHQRDAGAPEPPPLPEGAISAGGFVLGAETRASVAAVDVGERGLPRGIVRRALLLDRDGVAVDPRVEEVLRAAGAQVSVLRGSGYGNAVVGDLQTVEVPYETFERTSAWLEEPAPAPRPGAPVPRRTVPHLEMDVGGQTVRETPFVHDVACGRLFGVVAEPDAAAADVCVVLLNAGPQRHIGPNRMWVQSARRWAARGVPSLRVDLDGIGDADGRPAGWREEQVFYEPQHVAYVKDVLARLRADGTASRFFVLGLCSGANWAFNAALGDETVVAALLINPRALLWNPWTEGDRETRKLRKLAHPRSWLRLLRGDVGTDAVAGVAHATASRLRRLPSGIAARLRRNGSADELDAALTRLAAQRTDVTLVFTDGEPLHDELARAGRLDGAPNVHVANVRTGASMHALQPPWVQAEVHEIMDDALDRALRLARAAPPS